MSYEYIVSINFKKKTISSFTNNTFPRSINKNDLSRLNDEEFIKWILTGVLDGDFHIPYSNSYAYLNEIVYEANVKELNDKYWEYVPFNGEGSKEEWRKNNALEKEKIRRVIEERLLNAYKNFNERRGHFIVRVTRQNKYRTSPDVFYFLKEKKYSASFTDDKSKAKLFTRLSQARQISRYVDSLCLTSETDKIDIIDLDGQSIVD